MFDLFKKASANAKAKLTDADIKKIEDTCGILFGKENAASKDVLQVTENIAIPYKNTKGNTNILAVGPSGSGKTYNFMLPNILKASGSYIIIDPNKALLTDSINVLQENGYTIKIMDFENPKHSETYNPFVNCKDDTDVQSLVECLLKNTNSWDKSSDPFFESTEKAFLNTLFLYVFNYYAAEKQTLYAVYDLCRTALEDEEKFAKIFEDIRTTDRNMDLIHFYDTFKAAPKKTATSICLSAAVRLDFVNAENSLCNTNTIDFEEISHQKTAVFLSGFSRLITQNKLVPMFCMQALHTLLKDKPDNHVTIMLDELPNIGYIPDFLHMLTTMSGSNLSVLMSLQSISQMEMLYVGATKLLKYLCETIVYFGNTLNTEMPVYATQTTVNLQQDECLVLMQDKFSMIEKKINVSEI